MYIPPNQEFYQGDIIKEFPFFVIGPGFHILKTEENLDTFKIQSVISLPSEARDVFTAIKVRLSKVIIVTQTCDIQNNNMIVVAPLYSTEQALEEGRLIQKHVDLLRKRRGAMKDWFYLPSYGTLEESFVDFQTIHYFPKSLLENYKQQRIMTLSEWGRHLFDWALSDFFARPIENKYRP